jgi:peptidoglycan hydrolase CwlO-like protein
VKEKKMRRNQLKLKQKIITEKLSWFFAKLNNIDKSLARLTKNKNHRYKLPISVENEGI